MYWICISFNAQHTYVYIRIPHGKKPNRIISEFHQRLWDYAVIMFDSFSIIAIENEWISRSLGSNATYLNGTNRLTFLSICSKLPNSLESGNKWLGIREWTKKTTFFCATIFVQLSHSAANAIQSTQFKNSYGKACVCGLFVCVGEVKNENKTRNRNRLLARLFLSNENDIYVLLNSHFLSFYNYSIGSKWWKRNANYKHTHECEEMCVCVFVRWLIWFIRCSYFKQTLKSHS